MKQDDLEPCEFPSAASCRSARAASASSPTRWPPCCTRSSIRRRITSVSARTSAISACDPGSYKDFDTLISQFRSTSY